MHNEQLPRALAAYALEGGAVTAVPYGGGHINDTYLVTAGGRKYILQRINTNVFEDFDGLMENVCAVTQHLAKRIRVRGGDPERETMTVVLTRDGRHSVRNEEGCWRLCSFVQGSRTYDTAERPEQLESAAHAFGRFFMDLGDFPAETLKETIPLFHHTPNRLRQLQQAASEDRAGRASQVQGELAALMAFAGETSWLTDRLERGELPLRVTHNDTKLNNILFDEKTDEGLCVIDLDTVMPGLLAYDFGDAIRVGANTTSESDTDISHVQLSIPHFTAYARGLLASLPGVMTDAEAASLVMGAKLMTWEVASRFLADYLNGDVYFRVHYPTQNLDRARNQIALVQDIHRHQEEMEAIVAQLWQQVKKEAGA